MVFYMSDDENIIDSTTKKSPNELWVILSTIIKSIIVLLIIGFIMAWISAGGAEIYLRGKAEAGAAQGGGRADGGVRSGNGADAGHLHPSGLRGGADPVRRQVGPECLDRESGGSPGRGLPGSFQDPAAPGTGV